MSKIKTFRVGVIVIVLLTTMTLAPPLLMSQNAAATHNCQNKDRAVLLATFTYVNNDKCMENHVGDAVKEVRNAEGNKTKTDLYEAAVSSDSKGDVTTSIELNYANDTKPRVWMLVEKSTVNEFENGGTLTNAKSKARSEISDYYTTHQQNVVTDWEKDITQFEYLDERVKQESTISNSYVQTSGAGYYLNKTVNVTYVNDSTEEIKTYETYDRNRATKPSKGIVNDYNTYSEVYVQPPTNSYNRYVFLNHSEYGERWNRYESLNNEMQNQSDVYVENVWRELESGNIDSQDVLSSITKMEEYGVEASQDGGYHNTIGALAGMGIATPQLNQTGSMEVRYKGQTYNGMILADTPPNGGWQTKQYNVSNISGLTMLATTSGETYEMSNGETFIIKEITDKDGNTVDSVDAKTYKYDTANASELDNITKSLLGLTQELEDRASSVDSNGGGGGGSSNVIIDFLQSKVFGIPIGGLVAILMFVLAFIQNRNRN